jgi:diacylglycerol kinase (ATP)
MHDENCSNFNKKKVLLPVNIEVLVDLKNIESPVNELKINFSWGSGSNPWGPEREDQFEKPTHYDGMLEIVGVTGVVHMGQIHSGLRTGIRIAQGGHVSIK